MTNYSRERAWPVGPNAAPVTKGFDLDAVEAALDTMPAGTSSIVMVDGVVIASRDPDTIREAWSFTKSLVSIGTFFGFQDALQNGSFFLDAEMHGELNHTQGWDNGAGPGAGTQDPGLIGQWAYSSRGFHRVAEKVATAANMPFERYLQNKLSRLEIDLSNWDTTSKNYGYNASLSVRDASKILLMLTRGGEWQGSSIMLPRYVNWMFGWRNSQVPHNRYDSYRDSAGQDPRLWSGNGWYFGNNEETKTIEGGGFGGQGGGSGVTFVGWSFPAIDMICVTAGPDARLGADVGHLIGQPFAQIAAARTGIGV